MRDIIRPYEISIWTLQDSFITILKPYSIDVKTQLQEANMVLKDDGENTFSFKIPMYVYLNGTNYRNPLWENTINGNLIANMRKIKVIFDKCGPNEEVFEFIITKVTDEHEGFTKFCHVECDSLAFHELGRQGYMIELSIENYQQECLDFDEGRSDLEERPINNIDYWANKVLENTNWTHSVQMDWSNEIGKRDSDKVYDSAYISDWKDVDGKLIAVNKVGALEKYAGVEGSKSNRYNLLVSIAEAFQVFIKFVYHHDNNYHITGREVIFYNNFIKEKGDNEENEVLDFTYSYNTRSLKRELDSTDLVTKMYVDSLSEPGIQNGVLNLDDSSANKSKENYIMNFDYLYEIGTINDVQYEAVKEFENKIGILNRKIMPLQREIADLETEMVTVTADMNTASDMLGELEEEITTAEKGYSGILALARFTVTNPDLLTLFSDYNKNKESDNIKYYYVKFDDDKKDGIIINDNLKFYKTKNNNGTLSDEVTPVAPDAKDLKDQEDKPFIGKISFEKNTVMKDGKVLKQLYATYDYIPNISQKIKIDTLTQQRGKYQEMYNKNKVRYEEICAQIGKMEEEDEGILRHKLKAFTAEKKKLLSEFEVLMGPALREGTWTPEEFYLGYKHQDIAQATINTTNQIFDDNKIVSFGWDSNIFNEGKDDSEDNIYYKIATEDGGLNNVYYPCINLNGNLLNKIVEWQGYKGNLYFTFKDEIISNMQATNPYVDAISTRYFIVGASNNCRFCYIRNKSNSTIFPAIIFTGINNVSDGYDGTTMEMTQSAAERIKNQAKLRFKRSDNATATELTIDIVGNAWVTLSSNYEIVYPRFQVNSDYFINTENNVITCINGSNETNLEIYESYYKLYRNRKYYVTIKPDVLINLGGLNLTIKFNYSISQAATAAYLDAIEVLKENSVPKVSYDMTLINNKNFIYNGYKRLGQIAHINDYELKFENARGYISEINLNLDKPWEDTYTIKNYKSKFEDVFSSIVAQTEEMKKNSTAIDLVSTLVTSTGAISQDAFVDALQNTNLDSIKQLSKKLETLQAMINKNAQDISNLKLKV